MVQSHRPAWAALREPLSRSAPDALRFSCPSLLLLLSPGAMRETRRLARPDGGDASNTLVDGGDGELSSVRGGVLWPASCWGETPSTLVFADIGGGGGGGGATAEKSFWSMARKSSSETDGPYDVDRSHSGTDAWKSIVADDGDGYDGGEVYTAVSDEGCDKVVAGAGDWRPMLGVERRAAAVLRSAARGGRRASHGMTHRLLFAADRDRPATCPTHFSHPFFLLSVPAYTARLLHRWTCYGTTTISRWIAERFSFNRPATFAPQSPAGLRASKLLSTCSRARTLAHTLTLLYSRTIILLTKRNYVIPALADQARLLAHQRARRSACRRRSFFGDLRRARRLQVRIAVCACRFFCTSTARAVDSESMGHTVLACAERAAAPRRLGSLLRHGKPGAFSARSPPAIHLLGAVAPNRSHSLYTHISTSDPEILDNEHHLLYLCLLCAGKRGLCAAYPCSTQCLSGRQCAQLERHSRHRYLYSLSLLS